MDFDFTTETITPDATNILTIGGTGGLELSIGTTAQRPVSPINGTLRYNTDLNAIEGYSNNSWGQFPIPGTPVPWIDFQPIIPPAQLEGRVYYDSGAHALTVYDDITGTSVQVGFETLVRVRNQSGSTILNGQVVFVSSATGNTPTVELAVASAVSESRVIGVATQDIANNGFGKATVVGIVNDINLSAFTEGDYVYLSATTPGAMVTTEPSGPTNALVQIGVVLHAHATQGKLLVNLDRTYSGDLYTALGGQPNLQSQNIPVTQLNSGTGASATTFWRGDGVWSTAVTSVNLTQPAAGITVSGGPITTSGSITLALSDDLAAIEALSTTGLATRTASNTWTTRTITGTAGNISVTNGDGVSGNPTLNLVSVGTPVSASFVKITTDAQGRVTATTPVVTSDITGLVDATYVNVTGDTMSGNLIMSSGATVTGIPSPTNGSDVVNRNYVDAAIAGLSWKQSVRAATTVNGTLATAYENGDVIDGVTLATGDRILIKNQTTQTENGIYIVQASGAPVRSTDADTGTELVGASVYIDQGTTLADTGWVQTTNAPIVIGSSNIVWSQFTGAASYTAGNGLTLLGNQFSLTTPVTVGNGGTGLSSVPSNGALDIGNGTGFTRTTLTAGTGISVTNGTGSITLANTGVTSLTVTQPAAGITITNTGVSQTGAATATFALANDLAAVEGLATTGLATRTATDTWTTRTLTAASSKISITNGDGVSGNPTVDLGTVTLDDLSNVTAPSPSVGQMLIWDGTAWIPYGGAGAGGGLRTWSGNIASQTGTSVITPGTTPPTIAAGTQIASQAITPLSTSSRFTVQLSISVSASTNNNIHTAALFRDNTYLGGAIQTFASGGNSNTIAFCITDSPATLSSVTYSIRYGTSANTWYINRRVGENTYGGVNSGWEIQEY